MPSVRSAGGRASHRPTSLEAHHSHHCRLYPQHPRDPGGGGLKIKKKKLGIVSPRRKIDPRKWRRGGPKLKKNFRNIPFPSVFSSLSSAQISPQNTRSCSATASWVLIRLRSAPPLHLSR